MSGKTFSMRFQLNAALGNNFSRTFKDAGGSLGVLGKKINEYNLRAANINKVIRLRKSTEELTKQYDSQKAALNKLTRVMERAKKPSASLRAEQEETEKRFRRTVREIEKQKAALAKLSDEMKIGGASTEFLISRQKRLATVTERMHQTIGLQDKRSKWRSVVTKGAMAAAGFAAPVVKRGFDDVIRTGSGAQKTMSRVYAADPNLTDADKKRIQDETRRISLESGRDFNVVGEGFRTLLTAGFTLDEAIQSLPDTLKMAEAADISDFEQAAKIQGGVLKNFGLGADQAGYVSDFATNAALAGFMDLPYLGDVTKVAGKKAKDAGLSLGELGAMAVALSDTQASGGEAGTSIRNVLSRLQAPNTQAAEYLKLMNIRLLDTNGKFRKPIELLAEIHKKMDKYKLNDGERAKFLKTVFEEATMDHAKLLIELAAAGKLQSSAKALDQRGTTERVAHMQKDNLSGDVEKLSAAFADLQTQLFAPLEGPLRTLAAKTTDIVTYLSNVVKDNPNATLYAEGAVGVASAAGSGWLITKVLQFIRSLFDKGGKQGLATAAASTPWGRIAALAAAAFAGYVGYRASKFDMSDAKANVSQLQNPEDGDVPGLAKGGIATGPTLAMVGEGRESEAILPLSKLDGMLGRSSNNVVVNLSVNVSSSQDAYADIKRGIAEGSANLKRELERLLNDQRRLSFV